MKKVIRLGLACALIFSLLFCTACKNSQYGDMSEKEVLDTNKQLEEELDKEDGFTD